MKRISAIGVFSAVLLIAAVVAFVYLTILRPLPEQVGDQISGTVTPEAETGEPPITPTLFVPESRIAFVSDRDGNSEIYTMRPDGSDVVRLTHNDALDLSPQWSPDGTRIGWLSEQDGQRDLYVMNSDGSGVIRLTDSPEIEFDFAWSPEGTRVGYSVTDEYLASVVMLIDADGQGEPKIADYGYEISWSPDGQFLTYRPDDEGSTHIWGADTWGDSGVYLLVYDANTRIGYPAWNPQGNQIAFIGNTFADELPKAVYLAEMDANNAPFFNTFSPITEPMNVTLIQWSTLGNYLAFYAWNDGAAQPSADLYVIDMSARTDPVQLATIVEPMGFDWSPDESQMVYASTGENGQKAIYITQPDAPFVAGVEHEIIAHNAMMPDWSPYLMPSTDTSPTPIAPATTEAEITATPTPTADATATLTPTPADQVQLRVINVPDNQASVCYVHLAEAGTGDWQPDIVGENVIVLPDSELTFSIAKPAPLYDLLALDCNYNVIYWSLNNVFAADQTEIEAAITQTGQRIWVDNESSQPICEVSIDPVSGEESIINLLLPDSPVEAGGSRSFDAPPAFYNLRVVFCDGRISERRDFFHSEQTHLALTD